MQVELGVEYQRNRQFRFKEYLQNDKLVERMMKNSKDHLLFWDMVGNQNVVLGKIDKIAQKITLKIENIDHMYQKELPIKCMTVVANYISYLVLVRRENTKANQILRQCQLIPEQQYNLNVDKKIYIRLLLE